MATIRVCDICGNSVEEGPSYQFPIPSVLQDNKDAKNKDADSSMTDVCPTCATKRQSDLVARLIDKAMRVTQT